MELATEQSTNLSQANVTRRLRIGVGFLMLALLLAAMFEKLDLPVAHRLWLFVPFFLAQNAFFQAIYKTCGFSALRGVRMTPHGPERVADAQRRKAALRQGKKQLIYSCIGAAALTALFVWVG